MKNVHLVMADWHWAFSGLGGDVRNNFEGLMSFWWL